LLLLLFFSRLLQGRSAFVQLVGVSRQPLSILALASPLRVRRAIRARSRAEAACSSNSKPFAIVSSPGNLDFDALVNNKAGTTQLLGRRLAKFGMLGQRHHPGATEWPSSALKRNQALLLRQALELVSLMWPGPAWKADIVGIVRVEFAHVLFHLGINFRAEQDDDGAKPEPRH
jgi:hypothetical protein